MWQFPQDHPGVVVFAKSKSWNLSKIGKKKKFAKKKIKISTRPPAT